MVIVSATATTASAADNELRAALEVQPPTIIDWLNLLVYGDPGCGKTHMLGTAADSKETSPVLVFDVEGGLVTIRDKNVDVVVIRTRRELEEGYNKLHSSIKNGKLYYKTVGIDSLPELAALDMKLIMKEAYNANPDKVDIDVPSPREWGKCREHIRTIVRAFRDLPCNVVYTAQAGMIKEENQPSKFFPGFAGKLATDVPGFMDIVGYLTTKNDQGIVTRNMQVLGTNRVVAKDRTGTLGDVVTNPDLPMLLEIIKKGN